VGAAQQHPGRKLSLPTTTLAERLPAILRIHPEKKTLSS